MLGFLGALSAIIGIIGGAISIWQALRPPKLPKIEIPKIDTSKIEEGISKMSGLSDAAREAILNAINRYNAGELSPEMKAKLDAKYQELYDQLYSSFAQRGIAPDSPLAQRALSQLEGWYQQQYYTLLGQDLRNSLALAGLANADIDYLMGIAGVQSNLAQAYGSYAQAQAIAGASRAQGIASGIGAITDALGNLGSIWGGSRQPQSGWNSPTEPPSFNLPDFRLGWPSQGTNAWGSRKFRLLDEP